MPRHRIPALVVCLIAVVFAITNAQSNQGDIRGQVVDSQGAALPGADVTLSRSAMRDRKTVTDAGGNYSFMRVDPGTYTITASLTGFRSATATAVVRSSATTRLSLTLSVGALQESVAADAVRDGAKQAPSSAPVRVGGAISGGVGGGIVGSGAGTGYGPGYLPRIGPPFNTEAYDRIDDNQWNEVARKPLSTFSADVDTASYANVRRFLNQGQAPPKDAVRIEELINYFPFNYPDPRSDEANRPFATTTAIAACPWNPSHKLALIGLQARRIDASRIPPRNLVLLIDVSGSMMTPNKLPLVKASLAMLAPNLTEKDRVAIVVYAGNTGLVLPATAGSDTPTILEAIRRLEAGGSTNGGAGLTLAYKVAQDHFVKGGVNRVILATDGDFNVGVTDQGSLLRLIEEKRASGVALSILGYGMGNLKDSTMVKLADAGNGNYAYIDTLSEAQKVLVEQAGGTLVTVAKDVKLQVEFNPRAVAAYRLIGYEKRVLQDQDFNNDKKDAGEIGAGHSVTVLYDIVPAGHPLDIPSIDPLKYQQPPAQTSASRTDEAFTVKIRFKQPDGDVSRLMEVPVANRTVENAHAGFAAAVAEFGMLLRDSDHKGSASFQQARQLAERFKGDDPHGHRAEFIRLIGVAEGVTRIKTHDK